MISEKKRTGSRADPVTLTDERTGQMRQFPNRTSCVRNIIGANYIRLNAGDVIKTKHRQWVVTNIGPADWGGEKTGRVINVPPKRHSSAKRSVKVTVLSTQESTVYPTITDAAENLGISFSRVTLLLMTHDTFRDRLGRACVLREICTLRGHVKVRESVISGYDVIDTETGHVTYVGSIEELSAYAGQDAETFVGRQADIIGCRCIVVPRLSTKRSGQARRRTFTISPDGNVREFATKAAAQIWLRASLTTATTTTGFTKVSVRRYSDNVIYTVLILPVNGGKQK